MVTSYKRLRVERELTQQDVEKLTGIKQATLSQIERAVLKPSEEQINKLAQAYKI